MPGMDVRAALTVVGDGPVGAVGQQLDAQFGLPDGHHQREWAVGMKMVVDLPEDVDARTRHGAPHVRLSRSRRSSASSTCIPDRVASLGIFVPVVVRQPGAHVLPLPAALDAASVPLALSEGRQAARPGAPNRCRNPGKRGEPYLAGDGYARIGEGSGSTNVLTGSGVDEAWTTGTQLAEGVLELLQGGQAVHQGESRSDLRGAPPRQLGGSGRARRREGARRLPARRGPGPGGHGARRLDRAARSLGERRAASCMPSRSRSTTAAAFPPPRSRRSARSAAREGVSLHDALMDRVRLAGDSLRRPAAGVAPGRAADGRQGAGAAGLRRPRRVPLPGLLRALRHARSASRCAPARPSRRAQAACRRSTARSASTAAPASGTASQLTRTRHTPNRFPRRRRRIALGGELGSTSLQNRWDGTRRVRVSSSYFLPWTVTTRVAEPVPNPFVALIVTFVVPLVRGVPLTSPELGFRMRPAGSPVAL